MKMSVSPGLWGFRFELLGVFMEMEGQAMKIALVLLLGTALVVS